MTGREVLPRRMVGVVRLTLPVNPPRLVRVIVETPCEPTSMTANDGLELIEKSDPAAAARVGLERAA